MSRLSPASAVHVAVSWLTVIPVPTPAVNMDRRTGGAVIAAVPVVGALLGSAAAALAFGLSHTSLPSAMAGALLVAGLALITRGMHVDGLADTVDGLGCYGPPERVAEVMKSGSVGPFGAAAIVVAGAVQAIGFAALSTQHRWYDIVFAVVAARVAAVLACRRSLPPAAPAGFGAMVAGTQRFSLIVWPVIMLAGAATLGATGTEDYDVSHALTAATTFAVMCAAIWLLSRHCARRIGGITGDVLGAAIELGLALTLVGLLAG